MKSVRMFIAGALAVMAMTGAMTGAAWAQDPVGKWVGTLKAPGLDLPLVLIVNKDAEGKLSAKLESTAQAPGQWVPVDTVASMETPKGIELTFAIAALLADYKGVWNTEARVWVGMLTQGGQPMKLTMTRGEMRPSD